MKIGKPLRTLLVEPLEDPVGNTTCEPGLDPVPAEPGANSETEEVPTN